MSDPSRATRRFDKPGTTRDFTSTQFELIQLSHEWEKLRDQVDRMPETNDVEPPFDGAEGSASPTITPTTAAVSDLTPTIRKSGSGIEQSD